MFFALLTFFCKQCFEKDFLVSIVDITNSYKKLRYELILITSWPPHVVATIQVKQADGKVPHDRTSDLV
jgi:tRNA uridine 5-carbamoylmethylation protein Kti12